MTNSKRKDPLRGGKGAKGTTPKPKVFDFFSAKNSLPLVKVILADIVSQSGEYQNLKRKDMETPATNALPSEDTESINDLKKKVEVGGRIRELAEELKRLGVCLLDPNQAIVGFPSVIHGKMAYLIFRHKDESIATWKFVDQPTIRPIPSEWR